MPLDLLGTPMKFLKDALENGSSITSSSFQTHQNEFIMAPTLMLSSCYDGDFFSVAPTYVIIEFAWPCHNIFLIQ